MAGPCLADLQIEVIIGGMSELSKQQRLALKKRAHHLAPVVLMGQSGLTDGLINEIDRALNDHELIKVKLASGRDERSEIIKSICDRLDAEPIQQLGRTATLFRPKREEDETAGQT